METNVVKSIYDLEYSKLNNVEIVQKLDELTASYLVYSHKLVNFRWNIVGKDYHNLRKTFAGLHERAFQYVNEIAERIRVFDQTPVCLLKDIVKLSVVEENGHNLTGFEMVREILTDILKLLSLNEECLKTAMDLGDYGTEEMTKKIIYEMEKDHRSLLSWLK
jgi:starvation-inducible DNA-binding protein